MSDLVIKINNWDKNQGISGEDFPCLYNLSGRFMYRLLPCPINVAPPEFVYIPYNKKKHLETLGIIGQWNFAWEAAQFRTDICTEGLPDDMQWLKDVEDRNIYLLPHFKQNRYSIHAALYHLLPQNILQKFGLPIIKKGQWPASAFLEEKVQQMPKDFDARLSQAFAHHIWPLLNSQSGISSFDKSDSIHVLAHNLNYWLPYAYKVAETRLNQMPGTEYEDEEHKRIRDEAQSQQPPGIVDIRPPVKGGAVWQGEADSWDATRELIECADHQGKLRSIIDAVKSHRVEDDFSNRWSYAREDFERKMYSKRSKTKIAFIELDETIPVHSHESEVHEKLLWENFITLLDPKEKQIVVCIRNGTTNLGEIAQHMGYANHSPISKSLVQIQKKAKKFLE